MGGLLSIESNRDEMTSASPAEGYMAKIMVFNEATGRWSKMKMKVAKKGDKPEMHDVRAALAKKKIFYDGDDQIEYMDIPDNVKYVMMTETTEDVKLRRAAQRKRRLEKQLSITMKY